jgi:polysaccharide pyruvyl transferase WcaK-like protein
MKIVIAEGGPAENVGSMALIENAIKIARLKFPEAGICVLTPTISSVKEALEKDGIRDVEVIEDLFTFPNSKELTIKKLIWLLRTLIWILVVRITQFFNVNPKHVTKGKRKKVLEKVSNAEYIFCIGAERINDVYYKTVFLSLEALRIYQRMGKKLIHFSLTIGPLFYKFSKKKARVVLDNSYAIFVRDQKSLDWLKKLNVEKPRIFNSYDIAILQEKFHSDDSLLFEFDIAPNFIGVSFIEWSFRKAEGPVRMSGYVEAVASTLDYISEKYQQQIVFVPTVVNANSYKVDDIEACQKVINLMKNKNNVILIDRLLTPREMATIFSVCKFSIVTRMHAAILCTGAGGKPVISINYLYKLREFMKNLNMENMSIDIDYVNSEDLIIKVDKTICNYDLYYDKVNQRMKLMISKLLFDINSCLDTKKN